MDIIFVKLYITSLLIILVIDLIWLGVIARNFYKEQMRGLLKEKTFWPPALVYYLLYPFGLTYFVTGPAISSNSLMLAIVSGAILGFLCNATYNLTNWATLKKWPTLLVAVDLSWGVILSITVSVLSFLVGTKIL